MSLLNKTLAAALSFALVFSVPSEAFALDPESEQKPAIKAAFIAGEPLPPETQSAGRLYQLTADVQSGPTASEGQDAFSMRVDVVAEDLGLSVDERERAKERYWKDRKSAAGSAAALRAADQEPARGAALSLRATKLASSLGVGHAPEDLGRGVEMNRVQGPGSDIRPLGSLSRPMDQAYIDQLNAQTVQGKGLVTHAVPPSENADVLHAMGDLAVAPSPTLKMRYDSLFSDKATVAQDVSNVRAKAGVLELPPDGHTGMASSQASLDDFVSWVKSVPDGDLPNIGYGVLDAGEIGRYERNVIRKSAITINISVKDAEPEARSAVLFHELYHYWDVEVAKNHYSNVSYGFIDPAHMPEHELDAYYLTAVMWSQTKPDAASSPLAKFLGQLPTDRDKVQTMVETSLSQIKK